MPEFTRFVNRLMSIRPLIPITSPFIVMSGPPELPGLICASVWIASL